MNSSLTKYHGRQDHINSISFQSWSIQQYYRNGHQDLNSGFCFDLLKYYPSQVVIDVNNLSSAVHQVKQSPGSKYLMSNGKILSS